MGTYYGEINDNGEADGYGVEIYSGGDIRVGCFKNGRFGAGSYVYIHQKHGTFNVGDIFENDNGFKVSRFTYYDINGERSFYVHG